MDEWGLSGWGFGFDRAVRRAGATNYTKKKITLSAHLVRLWDEAWVREVILHEIAHALAGPGAKHGPVWRQWAVRVGAQARRQLPPDLPAPAPKWVGVCPAGHKVGRFRRPKSTLSCSICRPSYSPEHTFKWEHNPGH